MRPHRVTDREERHRPLLDHHQLESQRRPLRHPDRCSASRPNGVQHAGQPIGPAGDLHLQHPELDPDLQHLAPIRGRHETGIDPPGLEAELAKDGGEVKCHDTFSTVFIGLSKPKVRSTCHHPTRSDATAGVCFQASAGPCRPPNGGCVPKVSSQGLPVREHRADEASESPAHMEVGRTREQRIRSARCAVGSRGVMSSTPTASPCQRGTFARIGPAAGRGALVFALPVARFKWVARHSSQTFISI